MQEPTITSTESLNIIRDEKDNQLVFSIEEKETRRVLFKGQLPIASESDYVSNKVLIVAWLALGVFTPLADRLENLSEHGISKANFFVTSDAIMIAHAYRELTGNDITEAI